MLKPLRLQVKFDIPVLLINARECPRMPDNARGQMERNKKT